MKRKKEYVVQVQLSSGSWIDMFKTTATARTEPAVLLKGWSVKKEFGTLPARTIRRSTTETVVLYHQ